MPVNKKPLTKKQKKKINSRPDDVSSLTDLQQPDSSQPEPYCVYFPSDRPLNKSQTKATEAILSKNISDRAILIHGPPGTGKTTVIAAAVTSIMSSPDKEPTMWLVAQSNVAVKNIAEKLASLGYFDFKVLVSKDFHFDWHEHLYEKICRNVISSDASHVTQSTRKEFSWDRGSVRPLQTVIFDEASQIEISDYIPLVVHFQTAIRKLVFIGDDKQLAPHCSMEIYGVESIFEKEHLRKQAIFLDTQYRMPSPISRCISENVYDGLLKTQHPIADISCCRFVDVADGVEQYEGSSFINTREADLVIKLARHLATEKKEFRVITPYDAQRSLIERSLKQAGLPWKDKCFNIDSFQGNEDDYIIISVVRTQKLGFLNDMRRVNVMLTRCKKGMAICTSRDFMEGPGATSLIVKLLGSLDQSSWTYASQLLQNGGRLFEES